MYKAKFFRAIVSCLLVSSSIASAMENEMNELSSFMQDLAIGSAAGVTEVFVSGQPLTFAKNTLQQMQRPPELSYKDAIKYTLRHFIQQPPSQYYRGIGVNTVCMVPTTAAQIGLSEKLKDVIPSEELSISFLRNGTSGALAAFVCNPSELIVINQQNWKASPRETVRRLYRANGAKVFLHGYSAKALRDAPFCAGFLTAYPEIKSYVQRETGSPTLATILSTACVGPVTAAASHPFDTVSTRMQADASKKNTKGFLPTTKTIYREGGVKSFFSGFTPRTARVLVAIPLMTAVKEWLGE